jgi:predicted amidohydrolase YtcJ
MVAGPARPGATAMVVDGERVAWVGSGADADRAGVDQVVELDGAYVTAAFVDAHVHSTTTGLALTGLDLTGVDSLAAALARVEQFARARRGLGILLGHGWDETRWPERRPPTRTELDRATYGSAVYLSRIDVHSAVASSALMAALTASRPGLAGLDGWSPDGLLSRDAHHAARALALASVSPAQRAAAQRATLARCAELGIAALHELGGPEISSAEDFAAMLALGQQPGPEVVGYWGELGGVERARELGARGAAGDLFADGALGSHTAYLRTVYADQDSRGFGYLGAEQVRDHVVACTGAGVQAGFHVIGDAALDAVLAGFTEAAAQVSVEAVRTARHRLEHVEMPDAGHLAAMATLGVHASVQPVFDALWGGREGMYVARLGRARAEGMNPFAAMAAAGIPLALGSDSPVTPLGPWQAVRAAIQHRTPGAGLPADVAFDAHTRGGWRAAGVDDAGRLEPGQLASYAVWDGEPDLSPAGAGTAPSCLRTAVRGQAIWTREGALA